MNVLFQMVLRILDQLAGRAITRKAASRLNTLSTARKITLDQL